MAIDSKKEKTFWQKTCSLWITIWIIFNPSTLVAIGVAICLAIDSLINSSWKERKDQIQQRLVPLCRDNLCVLDKEYAHHIDFSYENYISYYDFKQRLKIENSDYDIVKFLVYLENHYYFLFNKQEKEYCIGKTDTNFDNFEYVFYFDEEIESYNSGYDSKMYYKTNSGFYELDLFDNTLEKIPSDSEDIKIFDDDESYYKEKCKLIDGRCLTEEKVLLRNRDNTANVSLFDVGLIKKDIYSIMIEYDFKPFWHYSFEDNISYIVYRGNPNADWKYDYLIIGYSMIKQEITGYQMFSNVHSNSFKFFPVITIEEAKE